MTLLLGLMRKAGFVLFVGLIVLGMTIWFLGPRFGANAVSIRLALIGLIGFFMLIIYLMQRAMAAQRGSQRLEKSLTGAGSTAAVRPDKKQEIEQLKARLAEAIAALKASKLGKGKSSKNALYALPWYVIIGPPGSGKSTALLKSELNFPYMDAAGKGIRGIGGTRNCDFWFTSDAILLDTAGRYTTDTDDREEWTFFLDQLKKFRPQKPINGIIVAIAISDLMNATEDQLIEHARTVRARIDELIKRLGVTFPVYLLFTKCDLLDGFVETFEDLRKTERGQVWGTTILLGDERPPRQLFDREFERLAKVLDDRRLSRLASEMKPVVCEKLYLFPLEFRSAQESLADFVGALFQSNPYQEQPLFRGFYFSSGTQEGAPLQLVMSKLMDTFRLPAAPRAPEQEREEAKSYFIHDLFARIVFPDQGLAGPSLQGVRKEARIRLWLAAAASLFCLLWILGGVVSYLGNQSMINRASDSFAAARQVNANNDALTNLDLLDSLRTQLVLFEQRQSSWRLGWGLNQSGELLENGTGLYFRKFSEVYLRAAEGDLETKLKSPESIPVQSTEEYYQWVRTYLLVTRPETADSATLCDAFYQLIAGKAVGGQQAALSALSAQQVDFYRHRLDLAPKKKADPATLDSARKYLLDRLSADSYYDVRLRAYDRGWPDRGLSELGITERKIKSDTKIAGVYTTDAWPVMNVAMGFSGANKLTDWVLDQLFSGGQLTSLKATLQSGLTTEYMRRLSSAWEDLLTSIRLDIDPSPDDAAKDLKSLTGERGIIDLLDKVTDATRPAGADSALIRPLRDRFAAVHDLVGTPAQGDVKAIPGKWGEYKDIIDDYGKAVQKSAEGTVASMQELVKAKRTAIVDVTDLLADYSSDQRDLVEPLLMDLINMQVKADPGSGGGGEGGTDPSATWTKMREKFNEKLAGKFPFDPTSDEEAAPKDVENYFKSGDGAFWKLYQEDKDLSFCVNDQGQSTGEDQCGAFNRYKPLVQTARTVTNSLLSDGTLNVDFKLKAETPKNHNNLIKAVVLRMGDRDYKSDFGPTDWQNASWNGKSGNASLKVIGTNGSEKMISEFTKSFGLFRLLNTAQADASGDELRFIWQFEFPEGSGNMVKASWKLQALSSEHPFTSGFFEEFPRVLK